MINLRYLLNCPNCKKEFTFGEGNINCALCNKTFPFVNGTLNLLAEKKTDLPKRISKKEIIYKIKRRLFHPTTNFPFSYLTRKKKKRLYEKCLNDRDAAERFRRIYLPANYHNREGLVLDFGCGQGRHTAMLSQCGFNTIGMDPCDNAYWKNIPNAKFIKGTEAELQFFKDNIFDICLSMQVLMYIENDRKVIMGLYRLLKKKGLLILQVTNKDNLRTFLTKSWLADESFKRYYTMEEIKSILKLNGFVVRSIWTDKLYFPFFTHLLGFVFEILLPKKIYEVLSKFTPPRFRGVINIVAQKC